MREAVALKIQEQLARIGVQASPRPIEMKAFRERNVAGNYDAYIAGWRFNGKLDLASIFGSKARPPGGLERRGLRFGRSGPAAFGDRHRLSLDRGQGRLREARAAHPEDQPYTFLYEGQRIAAVGPRLKDMKIDVPADPLARLDTCWIAR